ncbi:GlxA family transcriptional regulator [Gynuella sp.]|uniref:choline metabolism transcriptional regulator GbdR n=1 Tax=Gynuella sp. TaxID=2969146 RepID=UPI003D14141D
MTVSNVLQHPSKVENKSTSIGFLLLENFTMIALASALEPLRMANQLSGKELYSWHLISKDGEPVRASDGISVTPDASMQQHPSLDMLFVAGGVDITRSYSKRELSWLQSLDRKHVQLGGICTGAYVLAHARMLDGYDCSAHWECIGTLKEMFPKVNCNNRLFTIDGNRITCSGGAAPMDMMLNLISRQHGQSLTNAISDMFVCDRVRSQNDLQRVPLRHVLSSAQPKLLEIVELMEANIEEPIELDDLAAFVGISRRQLERLFHQYLDCTPSRYYLKLRLDRARQLLKQTTMSIIEISAACGFVSTPHFSRCYRKHIGLSPRQERAGMWFDRPDDKMLNISTAEEVMEALCPDRVADALVTAKSEPSYASIRLHSA